MGSFGVSTFIGLALQNLKPVDWQKVTTVLAVLIGLLLAFTAGRWLTRRWGTIAQASESSVEANRSRMTVTAFVLVAFFFVLGAGWLVYGLVPPGSLPDQPEILMGLIIVTAIGALMTLLFIVAAGFSFMNLTDPKQPLGLPEGSIRAMIALILIMVFIIFGIYLFRVVGSGFYTEVEKEVTSVDPAKYAGQTTYIESKDGKYNVYLQTKTSDDGSRIAQQLLTTVGTLVVAVAGFYFGSTAVSSAVAAVQGNATTPNPVIKDVKPRESPKAAEVSFEILGTDFKSPKVVRLVRGSESMMGSEILSSSGKLQCKITIDKEPDGKWDLIVENEDGKQARLPAAFTIT